MLCCMFQDDAEFKKARGAELEYESLKVSGFVSSTDFHPNSF